MKNAKNATQLLSALFLSSVVVCAPGVSHATERLTAPTVKTTVAQDAIPAQSTTTMADEQSTEQKVNINLANYEQLVSLPGIGKVKALAIINYRKEVGMFSSVEDIQKIKGIGAKLYAKLQSKIMI